MDSINDRYSADVRPDPLVRCCSCQWHGRESQTLIGDAMLATCPKCGGDGIELDGA